MHILTFLPHYVRWHYTRGVRDLVKNATSFVTFLNEFFSLGTLFQTLFTPWERMGEEYREGFHPKEAAGTMIVNGLMRFFGFIVRSITIIVGFLLIVLSILLAVLLLCFWILYPVALLFFFSLSLKYLFS